MPPLPGIGHDLHDGETRVEDVNYDVIGFSMTVGPAISLYFEKGTHLLRRSERVFPGFGLVEYRFDDYETKNDIPHNRKFTLYLNGDVNLERTIKSLIQELEHELGARNRAQAVAAGIRLGII